MLCGCLDSPFDPSPPAPAHRTRKDVPGEGQFVPGNLRLVKTGGNALVEFGPSKNQGSFGVDYDIGGKAQVSVVVPPGILEGRAIQVAIPDGRMIAATVPPGMKSGSTLIVEFPAQTATLADLTVFQSSGTATTAPEGYHDVKVLPPPPSPVVSQTTSTPRVVPSIQTAGPVPTQASLSPPLSGTTDRGFNNFTTSAYQQLILVKVPPNTNPGTTIHVKVPGESTVIKAQVPPGVDEFHVTYTPPDTTSNGSNASSDHDHQMRLTPQLDTRDTQLSSSTRGGSDGNGMEYIIPIVAGTALMGAAGLSILSRGQR